MKKFKKYIFTLLVLCIVLGASACSQASTPNPTSAPVNTPVSSAPATLQPAATSAAVVEPTAAPAGETAPSDGVARISLEDFKALFDSGASMTIIDARAVESFQLGHIPGAISLPWKPTLTTADTEILSPNKPIITYCDCGPGEADGADVARQLTALGFNDVKTLADPSITGWTDAGYPTE